MKALHLLYKAQTENQLMMMNSSVFKPGTACKNDVIALER